MTGVEKVHQRCSENRDFSVCVCECHVPAPRTCANTGSWRGVQYIDTCVWSAGSVEFEVGLSPCAQYTAQTGEQTRPSALPGNQRLVSFDTS